jgi:hypothetical protein
MPDNKLKLTVVVSGEDTAIVVNPHQSVDHLVREALKESGNKGQPPENWILRSEESEIAQDQKIEEAGIVDGMKLYLNPKRGEGGN